MIDRLKSMPVDELQSLIDRLELMDSVGAAEYLRLSPITLRNPNSQYLQSSIKIGQYHFWRLVDLEILSPRTVQFSYIATWNEDGPVHRSDKITIRPYGKRGWEWDNHDGTGSSGRTNEEGDGLWWYDESQDGWQQQLGTTQFSLPRDARKALYKLATKEAVSRSSGGEFEDLKCEYHPNRVVEKAADWKVGYNDRNGRFVPVPGFGDRSFEDVVAECKRLNEIASQ